MNKYLIIDRQGKGWEIEAEVWEKNGNTLVFKIKGLVVAMFLEWSSFRLI